MNRRMDNPAENHDTPSSSTLHDWDRHHVWHAFTQMAEYQPLIIERADGCTLYDIEGNAYLDGVSSLWCNVHGHRKREIDDAIRAQLDRIAHSTTLGPTHEPAAVLAKRLVDVTPPGLDRVFYSDAGATAVEVAIKMAFEYWQLIGCLLYTSPSPRDKRQSRMPSSA